MTDRITSLQQISRKLLKRYPIVAIYLFGSQARGDIGPLSDYDFAVLFDSSTVPGDRFDYKLEIMSKLADTVRDDHIDLVPLNDASVELKMKCISEGVLIAERNGAIRRTFEHQVITQYLDQSYYDARYYKAVRQRILAGVI